VGLTPHPHLVPKVLEKGKAIPLLTLRAWVAYKKGEILPIYVQLEVLEKYQSFPVKFWLEYFALRICKS